MSTVGPRLYVLCKYVYIYIYIHIYTQRYMELWEGFDSGLNI